MKAKKMILFFYGQDSYRLWQKVRQLKEKFISSSLGDTNLTTLNGKTASFDEIVRQILALPFLSKKRLVIIENLLKEGRKETQEKVVDFLKKIPESTVLVFVEENLPDKRTSLFKKLNLPKVSQEFKLLENEALRQFVIKEVVDKGGEIEAAACTKLIEYVGSDLWRMENEINKLVTYSSQLTIENIELLVQSRVQSNIFNLIEATASRNPAVALRELYKLFHEGAAEIYILTMIVYQYRNLLIVKDIQEKMPQISRFELAKKARLHPFVLGKILTVSGKYQLETLKKIYEKLLDFESALKVGKIESRLALELLVFQLTR
ncbi:MAG: DNA polymerase III subunit delta [Patescibacteria group bacterium]